MLRSNTYMSVTNKFSAVTHVAHVLAALRLLAIETVMSRRRILSANAGNAPRLPENLFAAGIALS